MSIYFEKDDIVLFHGENPSQLLELPDSFVETIITDPPYGLSFMGKKWDYDVPSIEIWKECLRILKPGGTALIFAGSRTQHRMAVNVEDAGFILKDCILWIYGSGFPKATDISKQLDKGHERRVVDRRDVGHDITNGGFKDGKVERKIMDITEPCTPEAKLWNGWKCLSDDTEILTVDGWKGIDTIAVGQQVFGLDTTENQAIVIPVEKVYKYDYTGDMVSIKNRHTNQLVTPNHRVLCQKYYRETIKGVRKGHYNSFEYIEAQKLKSSQYRISTAINMDGDYSIGADYAELLGWVFTEGHYRKTSNNISISQSSNNKNNVDRIRNLVDGMGIKYREGVYGRIYKGKKFNQHVFSLSAKDKIVKRIRKNYPDKKPNTLLWLLPLPEKKRLYESLILGDGFRNRECEQFSQKDVKFLEWFQVFATLQGLSCKINKHKYVATIKVSKQKSYTGITMYNQTQESYTGRVWCITTKTKNFIARRKGLIFITGNSHGLKPAYEPILVAMKPNDGTYANNALVHGVSGLNIEGGRIGTETINVHHFEGDHSFDKGRGVKPYTNHTGRFPANIILDEEAGHLLDMQSGISKPKKGRTAIKGGKGFGFFDDDKTKNMEGTWPEDKGGGASRFFYCAKASKRERNAGCEGMEAKFSPTMGDGIGGKEHNPETATKKQNHHPTVKPLALMKYLCTLTATPTGGTIFDPFMGSGTTGVAAKILGRPFIGIDQEESSCEIAKARIIHAG